MSVKPERISFIVPSRNNLRYLKWSYESLRNNNHYKDHEICVADDFSNDGTWEWCKQMMEKDDNFKAIRNEGPNRLGHTILYDKLINEVATNPIVMIFHADMYACNMMDIAVMKHLRRGKTVVSATRIEPPLHPPGPEKVILDCGIEPDEFDGDKLFKELKTITKRETVTEGIFAPWAIYKKDFQKIGGHDPLFAPQSKEDSDIFNRFVLSGLKVIQTWEGFVYHMTCRGSRFANGAKRNPNGQVFMEGRETDEWLTQNQKSTRNFIRKWGSMVNHDEYMKPIIPHKYDIGFVVHNNNIQLTKALEPLCSTLYSDLKREDIQFYLDHEQKNTKFNLSKKLKWIDEEKTNDIIIEFDVRELNGTNIEFLYKISYILADSGEIGEMEYDIFKIKINKLDTYENKLIKLDESLYL